MIKPLLRIIPTYSGNVKISCDITSYDLAETYSKDNIKVEKYNTRIRGAELSSASSSLSKKNITCNLLGSSYDYDLRKYYVYNGNSFYESGFTFNKNEIKKLNRTVPQTPRNTDLEFGCKRISYAETGYQYEFFAPIYIDNINHLPDSFVITINLKSSTMSASKEIHVILNEEENSSFSKYNYLYTYLRKYLSKVDSKVALLSSYSKSLTLYGIDLTKGGMCIATDTSLADIFYKQYTMNNLDASIASVYKKNNIAMSQVLPLAFKFNITDILTYKEKKLFDSSAVTISGNYYYNGNKLKLYDFSCDYDVYAEDALKMDDNTGELTWQSGKVGNLMEDTFPSLEERWLSNYQFSNKLTKMYSRWKMAQSSDEHPYVINTGFAFNRNQDSNILYGQYPKTTSTIKALVEKQQDDIYNYSLVVPIGTNKAEKFTSVQNKNIPELYKKSIEAYQFNWFDIYKPNSDFFNEIEWENVINNKSYYKGILYDFSTITDKLDKFAVVVNPVIDAVNATNEDQLSMPMQTILTSSSEYGNRNAFTNSRLFLTALNIGSSKANWLYTNEDNSTVNSYVTTGSIYEKAYPDSSYSSYYTSTYISSDSYNGYSYAYLSDPYARYINPEDIGIALQDINKYYDGDAFSSYINNIRKFLKYSNIVNMCEEENVEITYTDCVLESVSILKNIDKLLSINENGREKITSTYILQGNEIIDTHIPGIYCNDKGHLNVPGNHTYTVNTYVLSRKTYEGNEEYMFTNKGALMTYTLDYGIVPNEELWNSLYPGISWKGTVQETGSAYEVVWSIYDKKDFIDPVYDTIGTSTQSRTSITSPSVLNIGDLTASYIDIPEYPSCSYTSYVTSIYNMNSYFVKNSTVIDFANNDIDNGIRTYMYSSTRYNYSYANDKSTKEYQISQTVKLLHDKISNMVLSYVNTIDNYAFYPVMFNGTHVYANKVFKKNKNYTDDAFTIKEKDKENITNAIWIDCYNMNAVLSKYKENTRIDCLDVLKHKRTFKAKLLNKEHLYWWYTELCCDENRKKPKIFSERWNTHLYLREKNLIMDKKLSIKDCFISIKDAGYPKSFKEFYECVDYITVSNSNDEMYDVWKIEYNNKVKYVELFIDIDCIKVNSSMYGQGKLIDLENDSSATYRDLYLYKVEDESEWESSHYEDVTSRYLNVNIDKEETKNMEMQDNENCLVPLFNEIYQESRNDTYMYVVYKDNNIKKINVVDQNNNAIDFYLRYSLYNINTLIELTDEELEILSYPIEPNKYRKWIMSRFECLTGKVLNNCLYSNKSSNNIRISLKTNALKLQNTNLNTIKHDGKIYGYYMIDLNVDNTLATFDLYSITNKNISKVEKYFKYVERKEIKQGDKYIYSILRELMPMMKISIAQMFSKLDARSIPYTFDVGVKYVTSKADTRIMSETKENNLIATKDNVYSYKITRYFGDIVPILLPVSSITDQWNLKYKDTDTILLDTGKYNSIGDSCIYCVTSHIDNYTPIRIYEINYDTVKTKTREDGITIQDAYTPLEYKHFNASRMMLLPVKLSYTYPSYIDYDNIKKEEEEEQTISVFIELMKKSQLTREEYLFLYNYYNVSFDTLPVKLNMTKEKKLWRLKYIFDLK